MLSHVSLHLEVPFLLIIHIHQFQNLAEIYFSDPESNFVLLYFAYYSLNHLIEGFAFIWINNKVMLVIFLFLYVKEICFLIEGFKLRVNFHLSPYSNFVSFSLVWLFVAWKLHIVFKKQKIRQYNLLLSFLKGMDKIRLAKNK